MQPNIQAVVWVLINAFSQIYSEQAKAENVEILKILAKKVPCVKPTLKKLWLLKRSVP